MKQTRRTFLATSAAAVSGASAFGFGAETPLLRIGAMSDNHLHAKRPATHKRTRACFELFRKAEVDIIADTGDIADLSHLDQLRWFRAQFDELFAGTATVPFFGVANHDYNYLPNTKKNDPVNIKNASLALGMADVNPCAVVKGYRFVSYFQNEKIDVLAKNVKDAVAANEGNRPIFVMTHVPPFGTTTGTEHWSTQSIRTVLNQYPQVINLTGHIHTAITWAANIWQGEFTAINLGAQAEYSNPINGECVLMDVFADRIEVRRYEAMSGREIGANDRWSIPLPLDPKNGPYRPAVRAAKATALALPANFQAAYTAAQNGCTGNLTFAAAQPLGEAYHYRVRVESRTGAEAPWKALATLNWAPPQNLDVLAQCSCPVVSAILDAGCEHRLAVTPVNCYDAPYPESVSTPFSVPKSALKPVADELVKVEDVLAGVRSKDKKLVPAADGWYDKKSWGLMIVLPAALSAEIMRHESCACVFDIGSDQKLTPNTFSLGTLTPDAAIVEYGLGGRFYTLGGHFDSQRYGWVFNPKKLTADTRICFVVREGGACRLRVNGVRFFVSAR